VYVASTQPAEELILLNFPDNVDLRVLIEYVSDRLGMNILYDEQQVNQKVTVKAPAKVSRASLQGL
jgi:type II secretory pathway component GspD/PulD (secretin)